jgi:hypothetical protein
MILMPICTWNFSNFARFLRYLCVLGRRRWTIAHPAHAPIIGASYGNANYSRLMPTQGLEGLASHRLAHLVKFVPVDLEAGDLLFVPPTWWHVVEGLVDDFSCGVNWFFTFPEIKTESRLDSGWDWINTHDKLVIPANMGMGMTAMHREPTTDRVSVTQPDGVGDNLVKCNDDDFVERVGSDVAVCTGSLPHHFVDLRLFLEKEAHDWLIARQLLMVALNSCSSKMGDPTRLSDLIKEIRDILSRRKPTSENMRADKRTRDKLS